MADDDKKVETPRSDTPSTSASKSASGSGDVSGTARSAAEQKSGGSGSANEPKAGDGQLDRAQIQKPGQDAGPRSDAKPSDAFKGPSSRVPDSSSGPVVAKSISGTSGRPGSTDPKPGKDAGLGSEWTASDDRRPLERAEDDESDKPRVGAGATPPSSTGATSSATAAGTQPSDATGSQGTGPLPSGTTSRTTVASPKAQTPPGPAASQRSLWPVAAGILLGALIGAGSAALVYRGGTGDEATPDPQVTSLATRVDALEKRPDPQAAVAALKSSITALDNQVATLRKNAAAPSAAPAGSATKPAAPAQGAASSDTGAAKSSPPPATPSPAAVDLGPINEKLGALQSGLADLKARGADTKALQDKLAELEGKVSGMRSATEAAQAGVSSVEGRQKDIVGQQKILAGKVVAPALAVVADSLVQQIDQGQPYAAQVEALVALGADPAKIAVLRQNAEKGVPSAKMLAAKFGPLAEPIMATANKAPAGANLVDRLKSNMFSIVSVRRADDTSGNDLPSRVARIKTALAHDDVTDALKAFDTLPPDAKAKGTAWGALAKTHVEAMSAARALQHDTIVALGAKKS